MRYLCVTHCVMHYLLLLVLSSAKDHELITVVNAAEEAAADAKQRASEAKEWIDNWKGKQ